jgi:hypothetical protein
VRSPRYEAKATYLGKVCFCVEVPVVCHIVSSASAPIIGWLGANIPQDRDPPEPEALTHDQLPSLRIAETIPGTCYGHPQQTP